MNTVTAQSLQTQASYLGDGMVNIIVLIAQFNNLSFF